MNYRQIHEKYLVLLGTRKIQIGATMRYFLTSIRMAMIKNIMKAGKYVEKKT